MIETRPPDAACRSTGLVLETLAVIDFETTGVSPGQGARATEIDITNGTRRTVAENLPIGLEVSPGLPPPGVPTGVGVGADGIVYMSADRNNAIYRIRPQR